MFQKVGFNRIPKWRFFNVSNDIFCFQHKKGGGVAFNAVCPLTKVDEKLVQLILHEYKIFNAEVGFWFENFIFHLLYC